MKVVDDGIIKYDRSNFSSIESINEEEFADIEYWRNKLYLLHLIGVDQQSNIGYGNISAKYNYRHIRISRHPQFTISGTQTGVYSHLTGKHYVRILDYDIPTLKLWSMGNIEASSETLTHAAIYSSNEKINAIIHIHSSSIWMGMLADKFPSIPATISYGTIEMAFATQEMTQSSERGVFAMAGHIDGVVAFGESLQECFNLIFNLYSKYAHKN